MLYFQVPSGHDKPTRVQRIGQELSGSFESATETARLEIAVNFENVLSARNAFE